VWAYTAQLGNGLSATISAEQRRMSQIIGFVGASTPTLAGLGSSSLALGATGGQTTTIGLGYGGIQVPDIVGNIRYDQTWGSAQISGAVHEVNAPYYGSSSLDYSETGHPGNKWGWVASAGLRLNFPFIAQGDYFQTQVAYTQGGLRYLNMGNNAPNFAIERGGNIGFGIESDCVYGSTSASTVGVVVNGTGCNLTSAWQVNASFEHYWTPQFHESFYGGIEEVRYNSQANAILCVAEGSAGSKGSGAIAVAGAGCNNNFDIWTAGSRFQYDFTKTLYIGVDFLYSHLDTAKIVPTSTSTAFLPPQNDSPTTIKDQNNLAVTLRMHKDFLP
jgi:hypothetical protein